MSRHDYLVKLVLPRSATPVHTRQQVLARRRLMRDLLREFERQLDLFKQRDPDLRVRRRRGAVLPLFIINTLPRLQRQIGQLNTVDSISEVPALRFNR